MKPHHASWHLLRKHKRALRTRVYFKAREGVLLRRIEQNNLEFDRVNKSIQFMYSAMQVAEALHG